jgi:hypothetical protein
MKINSELGYKPVPFLITTDPSFGKDAKPVQIEILKARKIKCVVYRNAFDPKSKTKIPPKHIQCRIWNRLKKIKQALFRRLIPSLASQRDRVKRKAKND